jgi:hypothetical protein
MRGFAPGVLPSLTTIDVSGGMFFAERIPNSFS